MIVFTKIKKIKQKLNLEPASAASGRNSRYTYGEIFANKIQVFFSEIFKKYWQIYIKSLYRVLKNLKIYVTLVLINRII